MQNFEKKSLGHFLAISVLHCLLITQKRNLVCVKNLALKFQHLLVSFLPPHEAYDSHL